MNWEKRHGHDHRQDSLSEVDQGPACEGLLDIGGPGTLLASLNIMHTLLEERWTLHPRQTALSACLGANA